ncbi:MAG: hypothetical protein FWD54_05200 [Endomicrobia bacterium]|nr:hypothetical protein [Endomicrobiia bacterium]
MKKKIWSYVLALALMVSVTGVAFSAPESTGEAPSMQGNLKEPTSFYVVPPAEEKMVNNLIGRITQVFNYQSGVLISVMDQDRNFTVFDAGRVRATFGYNSDGSFTMINFNLYGTDIDVIRKMPGASGDEKIKNFLLGVGMSEKQLKGLPYTKNEDGSMEVQQSKPNPNYDATVADSPKFIDLDLSDLVPVKWFGSLFDHLSKGVNFSASINLTSQYGASVTLNQNGKPLFELSYSGEVMKNYNYQNGFLVSVTEKVFKMDLETGVTTNADGQGDGKVKMISSAKTTYMDPFGRASYTTEQGATAGANEMRTNFFSYSSNGSLNSVKDLTTGNTTFYQGGKQAYTVNSEGFAVAKFNYTQNGSLDNVISYNNGVGVSMTVFEYGKQLLSVSLANNDIADANELRSVYHQITSGNVPAISESQWKTKYGSNTTPLNLPDGSSLSSTLASEGINVGKYLGILSLMKQYNITDISIYAEHLGNKELLAAIGLNAKVETAIMAATEKQAIIDRDKAQTAADAHYANLNDTQKAAVDEWARQAGSVDKVPNENKKEAQSEADALFDKLSGEELAWARAHTVAQDADVKAKANDSTNRSEVAASISRAINIMSLTTNGYSAVASISVYINNSEEMVIGDTTTSTPPAVSSRGDGGTNWTTTTTVTTQISKVEKETLSFHITVMDHGGASLGIKGAEHVLSQTTTAQPPLTTERSNVQFVADPPVSSDPAVIGVINSIITIGEKIYALVAAQFINLVDGGIFHAADGEEIYIEINEDMAGKLAVGQQAMFMGDVTTDINGKRAMTTMVDEEANDGKNHYELTVDGVTYTGIVYGEDIDFEAVKKEFEKQAAEALNGNVNNTNKWLQRNIEKNQGYFGGKSWTEAWGDGWNELVRRSGNQNQQ